MAAGFGLRMGANYSASGRLQSLFCITFKPWSSAFGLAIHGRRRDSTAAPRFL